MPVGQAVTATRLRRLAGRATAAGARSPRRPVPRARRAAADGGGAWRGAVTPSSRLTRSTISLGRLRLAQGVGERRLDQRAGELGEQLQVGGVAAGGRRDQEGDVGRAVLGAEVDRRLRAGRRRGSAPRRPWCGSAGSRSRPAGRSARSPRGPGRRRRAGRRRRERPASPTTRASARITSCLSEPRSASRRTRSVVIRSDIVILLWW